MAKKKTVRPFKGDSLFRFLNDYTVVDIETTGLSPMEDNIIEIGAIRIRNGQEEARFSELINPERPISDFITGLTGITNEMLSTAKTETEIISAFREFVGDDIILGHNVNFDINFLYDACDRQQVKPLSNNFVDTLRISQKVLPKLMHHRLQDLADYYGLDYTHAHRAVNDCENTYLAYKKMFPCD